MRCPNCGSAMKSARENYRYDESGLDGVTLQDLEVRRCPECGEYEAVIPGMEQLHQVLAHVIAVKSAKLTAQEVRFLRKYLGFSGVDFAQAIGVSPETVSRWEAGDKVMALSTERALRFMIFMKTPAVAYPEEAADLAKLGETDPAPVKVRARRRRTDWTAKEARAS